MGGETIKSLCNKICIKYQEQKCYAIYRMEYGHLQVNLYYVMLIPEAQRHYSFQRDNLSCRVVSCLITNSY